VLTIPPVKEKEPHQTNGAPHIEKLNINVSAYRVLYILTLLVRHGSLGFQELNDRLLENPYINRGFNGETITKYMNTLRYLNCAIPKANIQQGYQYRLTKTPFPIHIKDEEIEVLNRVLAILIAEPDDEYYHLFQELLQKVAWSIGDENKSNRLFEVVLKNGDDALINQRKKLSYYRKLCREAHAIEINYRRSDGQENILIVEPKQISQQARSFYLIAVDRQTCHKLKLDIEAIITVRQLPFKARQAHRSISVTFQLTGNLAKNYRLYPHEAYRLQQPNKIVVKAMVHDVEPLINRLIKYGQSCEVLSPGYIRQEMVQRIQTLITHLSGA